MAADTLIDLEHMQMAAECLKTLAHPHRLRMIEMLLKERYTVGELAEACAISSNIASGHLRLMQRCRLLAPERDGRHVYYRVSDPCLKKIMTCLRDRFAAGNE